MTNLAIQLQCPLPQLDFDIITLGHGSGGLLTNQLLEKGVFKILSNDLLDQHHDGAIFELNGKTAFTTDSFVISPIFFPHSNIGELAVNGTVNDLAMCGAMPKYLSLSFILEEGLRMEEFWEVLLAIRVACQKAGVQVVTGDTKVVEKGKGDKIFINTTGIGLVHPQAQTGLQRVQAGDVVFVSGLVASHGIAIMSMREGLQFETDLQSDTQPLHLAVKALLDQFGSAIHLLKDPTRGGLAAVLNEIARDTGLGIELWQKNIPIAEQVESACEILGLDPLYVANEGIFLCMVAADVADAFEQALRALPEGRQARRIGQVVQAHPKQVVLQSAIGGKRVVNMPIGEQLPRIC
ncbi:MAG TPA: hydrogenase expression/formation protein HypE [Microscillaceae bacterium]|jgi:hydrogenase expression/formation protein HypE|nr:hydrogenase expression/formation protein HypE [Microscillaceae bacterium]